MSKEEFLAQLDELVKQKNFSKLFDRSAKYIDKYPTEINGYYYKVVAKTSNFTYTVDDQFEALTLLHYLRSMVNNLEPKNHQTRQIDKYIIKLTKDLTNKIANKRQIKITENELIIIGTIIMIVLMTIAVIIF